eukprot:9330269-Alexandrium_andersonii.AAC.1
MCVCMPACARVSATPDLKSKISEPPRRMQPQTPASASKALRAGGHTSTQKETREAGVQYPEPDPPLPELTEP